MIAAWLALLPCIDPDGLRELLGEGGALELHRRAGSLGDAEAVAEVLAAIYGADPMESV